MKLKSLLLSAFFITALFFVSPQLCSAQCSTRYLDSTFTQIDTTFNVIYTTTAGGGTDTLLLDLYQPHGDTANNRKLIVWAHGGAFFKGTKNDNDIQFLCTNFANRGYVCASINYRLAPNVLDLYDSVAALGYITKAINDMKASIRYFRKDAANGNTYRIDTNLIYGAGSSAGAIMIDFATTLDSVAEAPAYIQTIINNNGGLEGNSGNLGYSSKVIAAASLAGGISEIGWIGPGNPPTIYVQGTADPIIPYGCADVFQGYTGGAVPLFRLCGSSELEPQMASLSIPTGLMPFVGGGHVPWNSDQHEMNEVDSAVAVFFYTLSCPLPTGITTINTLAAQINVFPNPTTGKLHVAVEDENEIAAITVSDYTGRQIIKQAVSGKQIDISLPAISAGVYILQIQLQAGGSPVVKKIIVE